MENIIEKVYNSRNTIIDMYKDFNWNTDVIPALSQTELETIFNTYNTSDTLLQSFGDGMAFNMKIPHKIIENHNLVVIYYNFNNSDKKVQKITKGVVDKIANLYESDYLNHDDSLLIIINEKQSNTTNKLIHSLNHKVKEDYEISKELDKYIYKTESKIDDLKFNKNFFRHCMILNIDMYQINLLKHDLVPKHEIISNPTMKKHILEINNASENQLPILNKHDNIAKLIRITEGDFCKITRISEKTGESIYYRICK